ncbi:MAG TPA: PKD domain-containing protein [Candidatus Thermoplasmatota archaeon]|nr:PKD domain-containing protein [Candidatus Thermoplasmatota archaeon]
MHRPESRPRAVRATAFAVVAILLLAQPFALAADEARVALPGHVPPIVAEATLLGPTDDAKPIGLVVTLKPADRAGLEAAASAVTNGLMAPLTPDEVTARFMPTTASLDRVLLWLAGENLSVVHVTDNRASIEVRTTVAEAERVFGVALHDIAVADGPAWHTTVVEPRVPASVAPLLEAIIGLSDPPLRTYHEATEEGELDTMANGNPPFNPTDLRNAYEHNGVLAAGYNGEGRKVGITSWGAARQSDLDYYSSTYGLPQTALQIKRQTTGASSCAQGYADEIEWNMDVQLEHAMAPNAQIYVYCANSASITDMGLTIDGMLSANIVDVVSQSWGTCEANVASSTGTTWGTKFSTAASQGIALFTASGDGGSRECTRSSGSQAISPSWPATVPRGASVAGTTLVMQLNSWQSESTWNSCAPCGGPWSASGGGRSSLYARPSWQDKPVGQTGRSSGDLAAVADPSTGVMVRSGGSWYQVGGTSASSPIVAGFWTTVVHGAGRIGDPGEHIWNVAKGADYGQAFRDVTSGHNGDYAAGTGYDYPTGWGSPRMTKLWQVLNDVNQPPIMQSLACTPNPAASGRTVTCTFSASDGSPGVYYTVNWGDGSPTQRVPASGTVAPGTTQSATHKWNGAASYTVSVTATDNGIPAMTSTAKTTTMTVTANAAPAMQSVTCTPNPVAEDATSTCSFRATDDSDGLAYLVDWGDGSPIERVPAGGFVASGTTRTAAHVWADVGTYDVSVTAVDDGAPPATSAPRVATVTVQPNQAPAMTSVSCSPNPVSVTRASTCSFRATDDGTKVAYYVDWGDGSAVERVPATGHATAGQTVTAQHAWAAVASYNVTAYARDAGLPPLDSSTMTTTVVVVPNQPPTMTALACAPASTPVNVAVTCSFTATDDGTRVKYTIDWGDGSPATTVPASGFATAGSTQSAAKSWANAGTYTVTVRATDDGTPSLTSDPRTTSVTVVPCALDRTGRLTAGALGIVRFEGYTSKTEEGLADCAGQPYRLEAVTPAAGVPEDFDICFYNGNTQIRCDLNVGPEAGVIPAGTTKAVVIYWSGWLGEYRLRAPV